MFPCLIKARDDYVVHGVSQRNEKAQTALKCHTVSTKMIKLHLGKQPSSECKKFVFVTTGSIY
ncbi:hypothetical protein L798_07006 [Zootermopsis nevadensis]|uniref:Uncharacterized protein n=1 Tax=Zootermopsis nevadensis TaxID=136037 RepID=A0A067R6T2_ZOONE|nr:hypothetical protein L798_07006 [Zootermopsis nevadensis]